ncbi:hypothetical protein [Bathymodiolus platifrons methanotrophic gill symbiont]|uniref:hypothetical protein n=1 Tax=Bathymodiolus platifrons methanotrophic gill symbiont TaxID=113268 RepID=UPI001124FBED|nr:hypothetical protein [Bathymodiolus platifrons methanotrophic gill symbiont]
MLILLAFFEISGASLNPCPLKPDTNKQFFGSVAKNKITLLPTIIRFNFSQRNFTCSTKNGAIF